MLEGILCCAFAGGREEERVGVIHQTAPVPESVGGVVVGQDEHTYLFGRHRPVDDGKSEEGLKTADVRCSASDDSVEDEGFPKASEDHWWQLPHGLMFAGFASLDGVFVE